MWHPFQNNPKRTAWIDVARAMALFLVVSTHFYTESTYNGWAYAVHIPAFLFISGFIYNRTRRKETWSTYALRQCRILVPLYVGVSIVLISIEILLWQYIGTYSISEMIWYAGIGRPVGVAGILWFLPLLLWVRLLFDGLRRHQFSIYLIPLVIIGSAGLQIGIRNAGGVGIAWSFDIIPLGFVFYGLGYLCALVWSEKREMLQVQAVRASMFFISISVTAITTMQYLFVAYPNVANNTVVDWRLFYLGSVTGILSLFCIGRIFVESNILRWIGERTLSIYLFHLLFVRLAEAFIPWTVSNTVQVRLLVTIPLSLLIMFAIGVLYDVWKEKRAV